MALLETEGFGWSTNTTDYGDHAGFVFRNGDPSNFTIQTNEPFSDNFLLIQGNGRSVSRPMPCALATFFFGSRVNFNAADTGAGIGFEDNFGRVLFSVSLNIGTQALEMWNNSNVLLGSTPANSMNWTGWSYLEVGATIGGAGSGAVEVRINGKSVLSLTGVDTQANNGPVASVVTFGTQRYYPRVNMGLAHCYVCDTDGPTPWNNFLGDVRVQTLLPIADDAVQFAPSGQAHNWQNAAQVPPQPTADFNGSSAVGAQDLFAFAPMAPSLGVVQGVSLKALFAKSDAGGRSLATVCASGGVVSQGPVVAAGLAPTQARTVLATDPGTGAAWTVAGVNALQAGYKIVA